MDGRVAFAAGVAVGAGLMFMFDPDRGNRRRALVRDQVVHLGHEVDDAAHEIRQEVRDRGRGMIHEARARLREEHVDDEVLVERVRAKLGRVVSNPGAIDVEAENGRVRLSGPVLESELKGLLKGVESVRGVRNIEHRLTPRESIPGLEPDERLR